MISRKVIAACILYIIPFSAYAADFINGTANSKLQVAGNINIVATVKAIKKGVLFPYEGTFWGQDVGYVVPEVIIVKVSVSVAGNAIPIPLSAYSDLADPTSIVLEKTINGFLLKIHGSQTGSAYVATLYFNGNNLLKRQVAYAEFKDDISEETIYFNEDIEPPE